MDSQKIIGDALGLSGRRVWSLALSVATSYAVARLLQPTGYGLLAVFTLIPSLTVFGGVGWDQAAMRELPHLQGIGDHRAASCVRNTAYIAEIGLACCWALVAVLVACTRTDWPSRAGLLIGAAALLTGQLTRLFVLDTFVDKDFALQTKVGVSVATVAAFLKVVAAWLFGAVATFGAVFLSDLFGLWLYWKARPLKLTWSVDRGELWRLTSIGFPMAIAGLLSSPHGMTAYVSRAILGSQAGLEVLGWYVFASGLGGYLVGFIGDWIMAYRPHLLEALAKAPDREAVFKWMAMPSLAITYLAAIGGSCMLAGLPPLIRLALPKYGAVIPLLPLFFASAFLGCFYYLPMTFLFSAFANQQGYCTRVWAAAAVLFGVTLWVFTRWGWGLAGAAWATVMATMCVATLTVCKAYRGYISDWRCGASHVMGRSLPLAYVVFVHAGANALVSRAIGKATALDLGGQLALSGATLIVSCLPLLALANRLFDLRRLFPLREPVPL